jgi:hypothetical protein
VPFVVGQKQGLAAQFPYLVMLHLTSSFNYSGCGYKIFQNAKINQNLIKRWQNKNIIK